MISRLPEIGSLWVNRFHTTEIAIVTGYSPDLHYVRVVFNMGDGSLHRDGYECVVFEGFMPASKKREWMYWCRP